MKNVSKDPRVYTWGGGESCPQAPPFDDVYVFVR